MPDTTQLKDLLKMFGTEAIQHFNVQGTLPAGCILVWTPPNEQESIKTYQVPPQDIAHLWQTIEGQWKLSQFIQEVLHSDRSPHPNQVRPDTVVQVLLTKALPQQAHAHELTLLAHTADSNYLVVIPLNVTNGPVQMPEAFQIEKLDSPTNLMS